MGRAGSPKLLRFYSFTLYRWLSPSLSGKGFSPKLYVFTVLHFTAGPHPSWKGRAGSPKLLRFYSFTLYRWPSLILDGKGWLPQAFTFLQFYTLQVALTHLGWGGSLTPVFTVLHFTVGSHLAWMGRVSDPSFYTFTLCSWLSPSLDGKGLSLFYFTQYKGCS